MSVIVVDVESDGRILGKNSMVCIGAVIIGKDGNLDETFYGQTAPISDTYNPEALAISGFSRQEHENFDHPKDVFEKFDKWIRENSKGRVVLYSDNNGYDASWVEWYMATYVGENPFGWSSRRIGDLFCGYFNDPYYKWKKHRKTKHTHNPVDDAKGNAEALIWLQKDGYKIKF